MTDCPAILKNLALLLERRGLCSHEDAEAAFCESYNSADMTASYEDHNIHVKIVKESIKNINKVPGVLQFAQEKLGLRFIIVHTIFCQAFLALTAIEGVQVFWNYELENDLFSNQLIPAHRLLTPKEVAQLTEEFRLRPRNIPKMDKTDFVARYMGYKVGDWVEVNRYSVASGISVGLRVVTNCSWNKLFES